MSKPVVRSLDNLDSSQEVDVCGREIALADLAREHRLGQGGTVERSGSDISAELAEGKEYLDAGVAQGDQDRYLTKDDVDAFCRKNGFDGPSVEEYNQIARRFEKPKGERLRNILSGYISGFEYDELEEHNDVIATLHGLYFGPAEEAAKFFNIGAGGCTQSCREAVITRVMICLLDITSRVSLSGSDRNLALQIARDLPAHGAFHTLGSGLLENAAFIASRCGEEGHRLIVEFYDRAKAAESGGAGVGTVEDDFPEFRTSRRMFGYVVSTALENNLHDELISFVADRFSKANSTEDKLQLMYGLSRVPDGPALTKLRMSFLFEGDVEVCRSALELFDYRFAKDNPLLISRLESIAKSEGRPLDIRIASAAWLLRIDPPKYLSQALDLLGQAASAGHPNSFLPKMISEVDIPPPSRGRVGEALANHLVSIKRGRRDEEMAQGELDAARAVREVLIRKFGRDPFEVCDPIPVLEERMRAGGTVFPNDDHGNYMFCSSKASGGFLGSKDSLEETIDSDRVYLSGLHIGTDAIARPMKLIRDHYKRTGAKKYKIKIDGKEYRVEIIGPDWLTSCPFIDSSSDAENEYSVERADGSKFHFAGLMPHLIEVHGFFEGRGAKYRLEPGEVVDFFGIEPDPSSR